MLALDNVNKEYISAYEAARRLGVTPPYIYKMMGDGRVPSYTRGVTKRRFVEWNEIRELFEMHRDEETDKP